ncbi:hypothetical protein [Conexibacter woesei]|uniref:lysine 5,6-aminomutase reactivase subunit KamB n=1 Tax=Conexibacter woesei TaxID=191495 RepID=UPI0004787A91|nr:hypothetical protein [Conexibacter woesei]
MSAVDAALSGADVRRLAIIGTAKNVGKTVALNALLGGLGERGVAFGVTSVGRDGEARDVIDSSIVKPRIALPAGTLVATALPLLQKAQAEIEVVAETPFRTPLGRVVVGRMGAGGGEVEIAGPGSASAVRKVTDLMFSLGATRVIIDGSLDRRAAANPSVSDGVILATGAVLDLDRGEVVRRTATAAALLRLPRVADEALRTLASAARGHLAVIDGEGVPLPREFVLRGDAEPDPKWDRLLGDASALVIRGALTEPFLDRVARVRGGGAAVAQGLTIVADDAAKVFLDAAAAARCAARGIAVEVLAPIDLLAVTVNPIAPGSHRFATSQLCEDLALAIPDVAVVDVVAGIVAGAELAGATAR